MIPSIFSLFCVFYELDWWSAQPTEWLMFMTLRTCQSPWRQERALCCIKHDALNALLMTKVFAVHKERLNRICYQFDWRTSWYRVLRQGIEGICNLWWLSAIEQAIRIQMSSSEGEWSWYGLSSQYDCLPSNVSPPLVSRWSSYGTFATGGGDGVVCVWDSNSRKKTAQFPRYFYISTCSDWLDTVPVSAVLPLIPMAPLLLLLSVIPMNKVRWGIFINFSASI